ncbi:MAG: UDP-N-acetylmuramate dehydrogenase [Candidatus Paceibacterota bacterium]
MDIRTNVPLAPLTTFRVGGPAEVLVSVKTTDELRQAGVYANEQALPITVLGGGSNVLIDDAGIPGVVIQILIRGTEWERDGDDTVVIAGAGESWDTLVEQAVDRGLWGIENLTGIPGSVGAAPVQNIGAYGVELSDVLEWVEAVDTTTGTGKIFQAAECGCAYRWSYFKSPEGRRWTITRVALRLSNEPNPKLSYKDLAEHFAGHSPDTVAPKLVAIREAVRAIRAGKFPDLSALGTAGSFFTNPIIPRTQLAKLLERYPELPYYELEGVTGEGEEGRVKVSAAWILDRVCGLKGYRRGPVRLFERQPLVLVAEPGARAADIRALADDVQVRVTNATGIELAREVRYLPEEAESE